MEQIKQFIEKAKADSELMAKLDALGAKNAEGVDEVVALAAEYGFAVTKEDVEAARCQNCPHHGELSEEELDAVSGGNRDIATKNRYDPNVCKPGLGRTRFECVGFMWIIFCDHYGIKALPEDDRWQHSCSMGAFNYRGTEDGDPRPYPS